MEIKEELDGLKKAVLITWDTIAADAMEFVESNEEAMEFVLDAQRMTMNGFPEADKKVEELVGKYGYSDVIKALCKKFDLF
jgi:hypothetical protein